MERKSNRSWFGAVFGLLFLSAGLAAVYSSAGSMIVGYLVSSNWEEVPAKIHDVKLLSNYGDTTTYSVESSYSYKFNGDTYQNDHVSLSSGYDNVGDYWQKLERSLRRLQNSNEATVLVNPTDPTESVLDRTMRWKSILFGSIFFIIFGGAGSFFMWASLKGTKNHEARVKHELANGIDSDQKADSWYMAAFGSMFLFIGTAMSVLALPDALRDGEYAALLFLLFVFIGAAIIFQAFKTNRAYRRFGPTPLFLDPGVPGIGGQLGGRFSINVQGIGFNTGSTTPLRATLTRTRRSKSGKRSTTRIMWQEEVPVHIKQAAHGVDAAFVFDIPSSEIPSKEWRRGSAIEWNVTVQGEFSTSGLNKFERNWEVVVEDVGAHSSSALGIPKSFLQKAGQESERHAEASALEQMPLFEDVQYITLCSEAGRGLGGKLLGMLVGVVFTGAGIATIIQTWWPGYLFALLGGVIVLGLLYRLGKSINVKIDKHARVLYTQEKWFGIAYASHQGELLDANQFKIKKTSSTSTNKKITEYYAIDFKSSDDTIRIADEIEGKKQAQALMDALSERCYEQERLASAA